MACLNLSCIPVCVCWLRVLFATCTVHRHSFVCIFASLVRVYPYVPVRVSVTCTVCYVYYVCIFAENCVDLVGWLQVSLHDVHFGYDPKKSLFDGVNMGIDSSTRMAIIGLHQLSCLLSYLMPYCC